jgi:hypothetical protein
MLNHVHIACAERGCHATITVHEQEHARLRRTHETFYCPAGHSNYYSRPRKTEKDEKIASLERQRDSLREDLHDAWGKGARLVEALTHDAQTCPIPTCAWRGRRRLPWAASDAQLTRYFDRVWFDLAEHLYREHGARLNAPKQIPEKTGEAM